jgi:hypothetical protein
MCRFLLVATMFVAGCSQSPAELAALEARKSAEDKVVLALVLEHFAAREFEWSARKQADDAILVVDWQSQGPSAFISADQVSADFSSTGKFA